MCKSLILLRIWPFLKRLAHFSETPLPRLHNKPITLYGITRLTTHSKQCMTSLFLQMLGVWRTLTQFTTLTLKKIILKRILKSFHNRNNKCIPIPNTSKKIYVELCDSILFSVSFQKQTKLSLFSDDIFRIQTPYT